MGLIFKKHKKTASAVGGARERIAVGVLGGILKLQRRWSVWMDKKINHLPLKKKKTYGALSAVGIGLYCLYLIVSSLFQTVAVTPVPQEKTRPVIRLEKHPSISDLTDSSTHRKILEFKKYMDQLDQTEEGRKKKASFLKFRPGLMDSLKLAEQLTNDQ